MESHVTTAYERRTPEVLLMILWTSFGLNTFSARGRSR